MAVRRGKPVSLLAFLCGMALLFAASTTTITTAALVSEEQPDRRSNADTEIDAETEDEDEDTENDDDDDEHDYDPHVAVLIWLKNRANFAEEANFITPWRDFKKDEEYQFQNGFFFSSNHLRVLSGYNQNDGKKTIDAAYSKELDQLPRIVASSDIPKGELLVGVPSNSFVYKHTDPTYKMLHPCDVTSKLLSARTYRFPSDGEEEGRGLPSLDNFVRPFIDSILTMEKTEIGSKSKSDRRLWSIEQLDFLTQILGNELDPKANTLGLWGDNDGNSTESNDEKSSIPVICKHPNTKDKERNKIVDHFFNSKNPRAEEFQRLFVSTVTTVVTRSWNHRMVPIYHWIPRSDDDFNVVHSEAKIEMESTTDRYWKWPSEDSGDSPSVYELHAAKDIKKGDAIILPYHSVAQKFATEGAIGRTKEKDDKDETHYRFWTQTLHDQWGTDSMYGDKTADPFNDYLSWDYYPKSQTIRWVHKADNVPNFPEIINDDDQEPTLRATQRNVLQAQYLRLRSIEDNVQGLLVAEPGNAGNAAIVEYYELWVESLGLLLANNRPHRSSSGNIAEECLAGSENGRSNCASSPVEAAYDDLRLRSDGDPIDYNRFIVSEDCTNMFKQTYYENTDTPYAFLEWSRSYIGGGGIGDHWEDLALEEADEREQDTCLHLENVLHSCLAFRPHVHETLIHYPASFLPKNGMKRVLYVGGGDLVLLHELLRYKSIELVIGLEIDQTVLRHSFRHYGIQPKFEDERVHWWFGDAAKSLTLLPPEEYFGTFDMVLIDLVTEIFDGLKVGDHNERLVDYMAKLLTPNGIMVRQEDWPLHNVVDFAKYTVDLNIFGMPHTCSQYFTMASNTVDFANHERVDHELEDLVWYEPKIESHDHTLWWGDFRNNLDPPERICIDNTVKQEQHVLPSKGLFVAIEAENVTMNLGETDSIKAAIQKALEAIGFKDIDRHDTGANTMVFVFEEGYLAIRSFPEQKFASMDLQLWNDMSKKEIARSTLVGAIGGDITNDSTSTFFITTGGMFGISNMEDHSTPIVPSAWCEGDSTAAAAAADQTSTKGVLETALSGLEIVAEEMLSNFINRKKEGYVALVLCPNSAAFPCRLPQHLSLGPETEVVSFHACPSIENGDDSALEECEQQMRAAINEASAAIEGNTTRRKIRAIVIDSEAPRELGQIALKLFASDPSSFHWLSHDFVLLVPSGSNAASSSIGYPSSWRYQLLERFRTDMVEFHPVYHATVAFRDATSSNNEWAIGILSAGNPRFYGHLIDSLDAIRGHPNTPFEEVILVETKTGAISHIPDYQPSKWATPSDYDIKPAEEQYFEQKPVGVQLLVQHEKIPVDDDDIEEGDKVLFYRKNQDDWCTGVVQKQIEDGGEMVYAIGSKYDSSRIVDRNDVIKFDYDDETPVAKNNAIPFGTTVLADGDDDDDDDDDNDDRARYFYAGQIIGMHNDGRYKIYFLNDGSFGYRGPHEVTPLDEHGSFKSPSEAKIFSSCDEFYQIVSDKNSGHSFQREIGDGCLAVVSWPEEDGEITTIVATYDGQIHIDFNVYISVDAFERKGKSSLVNVMNDKQIEGTLKKQTDLHPRGYGRVVNFRHDLPKNYFGTKYPRAVEK